MIPQLDESSWILAVGVFLLASTAGWVLSRAVLKYAMRRRHLFDIPNGRSSHTTPKPRGAGLAIVMVTLAGTVVLWGLGWIGMPLALAIAVGGSALAWVGWTDDRRSLSPKVRIVVHFASAFLALALLGGLPELDLGLWQLSLGGVGYAIGALGIVWAINLYNFMDGIDGFAGGEALFVGASAGGLLWWMGFPGLSLLALVVSGASLGFLGWNRPPARIFMGDVGAGFLGYLFGVMSVASENAGAMPISLWVLLLGVFVFDATLTLSRRVLRRERWWAPHRKHAYQRLAVGGWGHARVTAGLMVVNVALLALTLWAALDPARLPPILAVAAVMLGVFYLMVERRWPMPGQDEEEEALPVPDWVGREASRPAAGAVNLEGKPRS
ncbi:MAG: glycosyltransferase family 4 protein [Gemmatimonadota bacterium]